MLIFGAFFVILMLFTLNTTWAHDPIPRHRSNGSRGYGVQKHREKNNHKSHLHLNKAQQRFEKAQRRAWADGKLTYWEMRKLHQLKKKNRRDIHRWKHHRGSARPVEKGHMYHRYHGSAFPKFTLHLSFSDPGTLFAGTMGVK